MRSAVAAALLVLGASVSGAQPHPITFTVRAPEESGAGHRFGLMLNIDIQPGWHLYALKEPPGGPIATTIAVGPAAIASLTGPIETPTPLYSQDPNFGFTTEFFDGTVTFKAIATFAANVPTGKKNVLVMMRYQACSDRLCLRPRTDTVKVPITIR